MDSVLKKNIVNYYSTLLKKYGKDSQSLGWGSRKGRQSIRFHILSEIGNLKECSILDVGCGFGDLYGFLKHRKINVHYLGVDVNPKLIDIAKERYPKANFEVRDIETNKFTKKFDWVFFSGLSIPGGNYSFFKNIMEEMFNVCKKGIALNLLGGIVDFKTKGVFYGDPAKIYTLTRKISNRVVIRHDYMPYEFTLYVYKNNEKNNKQIFKEYLKNTKIRLNDYDWLKRYK